jgi:hypothetical protein
VECLVVVRRDRSATRSDQAVPLARRRARSTIVGGDERRLAGEGTLRGGTDEIGRLDGVEAAVELPFASLHQPVTPLLAPPSPACKVDIDEHHADRDEAENDPSPLRHAA